MDDKTPTPEIHLRRISRGIAILILALVAIGSGAIFTFYPSGTLESSPAQPIPFSHRVHVTDKEISCFVCHPEAINTSSAGIPSLQTCMLCHSKIIVHHPVIAKLRKHYDDRIPVEWNRVFYLPDFVFFSHQSHIQAGFDCGKCHGDIAHMDRILARGPDFQMGFCVQCHRDEKFSHDCLICHR